MKNRMLKRKVVSLMMAMILTGSLAVTGIQNLDAGADVVQAADGTTDGTTTFHVEKLTYVDNDTIPVCNQAGYEDYIFAGWYSSELCKDDQILTSSDLKGQENTGKAYYAKFIPADVLSVKCQVPADLAPTDSSTNLRVVTTLDSDMYSDIGFEFYKYNESTQEYTRLAIYKYSDSEDNKLYKKIAVNQDGVAYNYSANIFDPSSVAYFTGTVTGIRQALFDTPILIKPFLMTKNGTQVYGVSRCIRISDSYSGYVTVPVYMNSDKDLATGTVTVTPRPFGKATETTADVTYVDYVPGDSRNTIASVTNTGNVVTINISNTVNISNNDVPQANGLLATLRYKSASNTWADKAPRYTFDIATESAEAADLSNLASNSRGGNVEVTMAEPADSTSSYSQAVLAITQGTGNHFQVPFRSSGEATGFRVMVKGTGKFTKVQYVVKDADNTTLGSGDALSAPNDTWTELTVTNLNSGKKWSQVAYITFLFTVGAEYTRNDAATMYLDKFEIIGNTTENDFEVIDVFHRNTQASGTTPYTNWYTSDTKEGRNKTYVLATLPEFYGFQQLSYGSSANTAPKIFTGETIMLASDLVLNTDHANYLNWVNSAPANKWLGIGCYYNATQYAFDGTFDGQGHDIYGVYMDGAQDSQGTKNGRGFFNRAAGTIKNFRLRNSCVIGQQSMVGSIVGVAWKGAGAKSTSLSLDGVYSNAYVKSSYAGGIVGGLVGTRDIPVSFNNCQFAGVNNGSFNTNYRSDGGLLGAVDSKVAQVTVKNCAVTGTIKRDGNKTAAATITGGTGGIVGKVTIDKSLSIEGCYINFTTDDNSTLAGAIVQRANKSYGFTVKNVLNDTSLNNVASIDLGGATSDVYEGVLKGSAATSETWKAEGFFDATYWDVSGDVPVLKSFMDIQ